MQAAAYEKLTQSFRNHPKLTKSVHIFNRVLTGMVFAAYPLLLLYLAAEREKTLYLSVIVPLDGFLIVSVFRYLFNRQRPYERYDFKPAIPKDTKGKSFPSRHVFSAAVIAVTFLVQRNPILVGLGVGLSVAALIIGVIRVIAGVHYVSDVLAAWACAGIGWIIYAIFL